MAEPDNIHQAMDHIEAAMSLLVVEMGSSAGGSCLMQFARSVSGKPLAAVLPAIPVPDSSQPHSNSNVKGTPPEKPKRRHKRSIKKRAERAESHSRWLREQEAKQTEAGVHVDHGGLEKETAHVHISAVPQTVDQGDTTTAAPTILPAAALLDGIQRDNKRDANAAKHTPPATPVRPNAEKRSRTVPHQAHHHTLFPAAASPSRKMPPPPQVALMAQEFVHKEIAASQWAYLAHPELVHTHTRCVHMLSAELIKRGVSEWKQMCADLAPRILHEQCVIDGVPVVQYS